MTIYYYKKAENRITVEKIEGNAFYNINDRVIGCSMRKKDFDKEYSSERPVFQC